MNRIFAPLFHPIPLWKTYTDISTVEHFRNDYITDTPVHLLPRFLHRHRQPADMHDDAAGIGTGAPVSPTFVPSPSGGRLGRGWSEVVQLTAPQRPSMDTRPGHTCQRSSSAGASAAGRHSSVSRFWRRAVSFRAPLFSAACFSSRSARLSE